MSEGCTNCGNKGGCDHRKGGMFAAIDEALAALYPTRRWGERIDSYAERAGQAAPLASALAERVSASCRTLALARPGTPEEWCDWVYVLAFGRQPSLLEVRDGLASPEDCWDETAGPDAAVDELHLRIALSTLGPFSAVQEVSLRLERRDGDLILTEAPRTGVFDPVLLPRYQKIAAALSDLGIRNLDFGDLTNPPDGFDAGSYGVEFGGVPTVANYLFYPQPASSITSTVLGLSTT